MNQEVPVRHQRWVLLGIILFAFGLRVIPLARNELWFDEALSAIIAGKGWTEIVSYTLSTPFEHPPFYYLLLNTWTRTVGDSEFVLRFFSSFWGVLLVPLLYRFVSGWGGRGAGLLAAFVAALSTVHIEQSQNVRMYTLVPVLGVLLLLCFFQALATRQRRWWVGFLLVALVGITTHYFFALLLLVPLAFLLLSGPRYRRLVLLLLGAQAVCVLLVVAWFALSPGFREATQQVLAGEGGGVSSLEQRVSHIFDSVVLKKPIIGHLALAGIALLGLTLWPLPAPPSSHPVSLVGSRRFVVIWLLVPWLAALAIPYWLQYRHLSYVWPALYALVASGLLALRSEGRYLLWIGLLIVLVTPAFGLYAEGQEERFEFGRIMSYIEGHSLPGDTVVMNQPAFWPFEEYYATGDLAVKYVPQNGGGPASQTIEEQMWDLVDENSRIWLGPVGAWTADPASRVDRWLATHAFQAEKVWFPGSGSAALYYTQDQLEPLEVNVPVEWDNGMQLVAAQGSDLSLPPPDAIRLAFTWQANTRLDALYAVSVWLVDQRGQVWAHRRSEPCSGRCPTDAWQPGVAVKDQHALRIPAGTPPGTYRLQLSISAVGDQREILAAGSGGRLDLGQVQVLPTQQIGRFAIEAADPEAAVQQSLEADFGDRIRLLGFHLDRSEVSAGGAATLELHWQAKNQPDTDYALLLELVSSEGDVAAVWEGSPAADFAPTGGWRAGEYLRGVHTLSIPSQTAPGDYVLQLALLDETGQVLPITGSAERTVLGGLLHWSAPVQGGNLDLAELHVTEAPDRARNFDLPEVSEPLRYELGEEVVLLGYDLDESAAHPGGRIVLTLYWQAKGPTDRPYKVFTHLSNGGPLPVAQHDSPPGGGCCPTDTWVAGEIVVDQHVIPLGANLLPGTFRLVAGMYHEPTGQRLRVVDEQGRTTGGGEIPIAEVVVRPLNTPVPTAIADSLDFEIFLPVVAGGQ
jgi:hypothetical protein